MQDYKQNINIGLIHVRISSLYASVCRSLCSSVSLSPVSECASFRDHTFDSGSWNEFLFSIFLYRLTFRSIFSDKSNNS